MLDVFLGVHHANVLVSHHSINCAQVLYVRVRCVKFLFQQLHDELDALWTLRVLSFTFMLGHSGVINQPGFGCFHILNENNQRLLNK